MAKGETFSFDEEARRVYGFVPPAYDIGGPTRRWRRSMRCSPATAILATRVDEFVNSLAILQDEANP
ncbi:MAG: hypothetical protein R3C42_09535 [Parvularculaceae bacterium]